ncbi:tetratricopeptide repeat protein [Novipirellula sp. SH528]|uniref:tetratricopeptide repeat protein n=1 Tax=Novipirellula sp. SH528 TaxID=3454466 RepID=UPI003F9F3E86
MSRRKNKAKKSKSKMRHQQQPARRAEGISHGVPLLDGDELLQSGAPPELVEMVMLAQKAALEGDMSPMEEAMKMIEAITANEHGGKSSPEETYPLSTPEAARALFAFESEDGNDPGYAIAAKQAIEIDPNSVEALVTLGDLAESIEDRVHWYRRASKAANSKPRKLVRTEMPFMRSQMGGRLVGDSRLVDAADVMFPGLDEDPSDNVGLRFSLLDLCFRLRWYDELETLLDRFPHDQLGPFLFAEPIYLFQSEGQSPKADALLRAVHKAKPKVARFLVGLEPLPPLGPRQHFQAGSDEEAVMIAGYLLPGIRTVEGTARWIRETLGVNLSQPSSSPSDGFGVQRGAGDLDKALSLPRGKMTWQYHLHRLQDGSYLGVLLEDLTPIASARFASRPKTKELRNFLLDSICEPMVGRPRKPAVLNVPTKADVKALVKAVGTYGVNCEHRAVEADVKIMLAESLDTLARRLMHLTGDTSDETDEIDVSDLPQTDEHWLVGVFQPPMWIVDRSTPYRLYLQLVINSSNGCVLGTDSTDDFPSSKHQWSVIAQAMANPMVGPPRRPERIILDPRMPIDSLDGGGDTLEIVAGDQQIAASFDEFISDFVQNMGDGEAPLANTKGVTKKLMERYYDAAARFYKAAPWQMVGGNNLIRLQYEGELEPNWGISVMGQLGQVLGFSLMQNVDHAKGFIEDRYPIEKIVAISVQFGEAFEMVPIDLWHLEQNHWAVAGEEAYPCVMKMEHGERASGLSNEELRMVESVMSIVPRFLDQPRDQTMTGKDSLGREFRLSWEL